MTNPTADNMTITPAISTSQLIPEGIDRDTNLTTSAATLDSTSTNAPAETHMNGSEEVYDLRAVDEHRNGNGEMLNGVSEAARAEERDTDMEGTS